jgi:hypothetical protein
MNNNPSNLEHHAAALGLTHEDAASLQRAKSAVSTTDKVLLGLGCCALAGGSAAVSVWMVVPTLIVTGVASVLLVRHLDAASGAPHRTTMDSGIGLGGAAVQEMLDEGQEWMSGSNRNIVLDPVFRTTPSNIYYDNDHPRR